MSDTYDLNRLNEQVFQDLVNELALRVIGPGLTTFGKGGDGGRDAYFFGVANYPTTAENWSGHWYVQSKFHWPHLSKDPQKWLLRKIAEEISIFNDPESRRQWPDIWIIATNVEISAVVETGTFDKALAMVRKANAKLEHKFHIWGGNKIVDLLSLHQDLAQKYQDFFTPGHLIAQLLQNLEKEKVDLLEIFQNFIVTKFQNQQYLRLDHAGSYSDQKPEIGEVFVDLPYITDDPERSFVMEDMLRASALDHTIPVSDEDAEFLLNEPIDSRIWFIKGGPGQGKSTLTQYLCQLNRASLILSNQTNFTVHPLLIESAKRLKSKAESFGWWTEHPRIPVYIELRDYAHWIGRRGEDETKSVLVYITNSIEKVTGQPIKVATLKLALSKARWLMIFDGMDEVPENVKEEISAEISNFSLNTAPALECDLFTVCTSRPQGYSGQFDSLRCADIVLDSLEAEDALNCADHLLRGDGDKYEASKNILKEAIENESIQELMKTPLQVHIMAVIVRSGQKPPERKRDLYKNFYDVIYRREANRNLADKQLHRMLKDERTLLKKLHNSVGFFLHAKAETSDGATTSLSQAEFKVLAKELIKSMKSESEVNEMVETIGVASQERLMLISTPQKESEISFDVRQLQEFFAAEYLYEGIELNVLIKRFEKIAGDSHWTEVIHFLMSALIDAGRQNEIVVAADVLRRLDTDPDCVTRKAVNESLARGSAVVMKLIKDGVLEDDKRIRELFSTYIFSYAKNPEMAHYASLSSLRPATQRWLTDLLVTELGKAKFTQNIYIFSYLVHKMPQSDQSFADFEELIMGLNDVEKRQILLTFPVVNSLFHPENRISFRLAQVFLQDHATLDDPELFSTSKSIVTSVLKGRFLSLLETDQYRFAEFLTLLYQDDGGSIHGHENSWVKWDIVSWSEVKAKALSLQILGMYEKVIPKYLIDALSSIGKMSIQNGGIPISLKPIKNSYLFPYWLRYFVTNVAETAILSTENGLGKKSYTANFSEKERSVVDSESFDEVSKLNARFLLDSWIAFKLGNDPNYSEVDYEYFNSPDATAVIKHIIEGQPTLLARSFLYLGIVYSAFPELEPMIRKSLVHFYEVRSPSFYKRIQNVSPTSFKLNIIDEVALLKPVLLSAIHYAGFRSSAVRRDEKNDFSRIVGKILYGFVPDVTVLYSVYKNKSISTAIKSYALGLVLYHVDGGVKAFDEMFLSDKALLATLSDEEFLNFATIVLKFDQRQNFIGENSVIILLSEGVERRKRHPHVGFDKLFNKIRERSETPLSKNSEYLQWLAFER